MTDRRGFLRGLGLGAVGTAAAGVAAPPEIEKKIVKEVVEHRAVYSEVLITGGTGANDGDTAMIKINGVYRHCVRRKGKWGPAFPA